MDWKERAKELRFEKNMSWTLIAETIQREYMPDETATTVLEKVRGYIRRTSEYKGKGKVTFEDKKEPTEQDVEEYYQQIKLTNSAMMKLEKKQNKANLHIDDDKPIAVTF